MKTVTIYTDDSISVDSTMTGYSVFQDGIGTVVRKNHNNGYPHPIDLGGVVEMPLHRYNLLSEAGLEQFKADFLKIWDDQYKMRKSGM